MPERLPSVAEGGLIFVMATGLYRRHRRGET